MSPYEEACQLLETAFGQGKDNVIALATLAQEPAADGSVRPAVRGIDAYYEDGVFYSVTNAQSNKMRQIAAYPEVSVASCSEMFTASGLGESLGWVLDPKNAKVRDKLRTAFAAWYDRVNNEQDPNCCFLAVRLAEGVLNVNHGERLYHLDFVNETLLEGAAQRR